MSHLSWVETKTFKLKKKTFIVLATEWVTVSLVLLLKLLMSKIHQNYCYINYIYIYFKMILKMILKSFDFQCDFDYDYDFQITTSRMILILNHLYLGDLILILKSTYDDFPHLWISPITLRIFFSSWCM